MTTRPEHHGADHRSDALRFHRGLPGYAVTPLVRARPLARRLGVADVWVKDESSRLGLPAFKILGASWAAHRALAAAPRTPRGLITATDGNHGRAVARTARLLGLEARVYLPAGAADARIAAIADEGAEVLVVDGTYDEAVAVAAAGAGSQWLLISDTSWPGYEDVPGWVVDGYATIFAEVDEQLLTAGGRGPDLVAVQVGVGSLAVAVVRRYAGRARVVSVEPESAACLLESIRRGERTAVPGPHDSIMAGLNCGELSLAAWPELRDGVAKAVAVADHHAEDAMRALAGCGVVAGESGAAGLAGLLALHGSPGWSELAIDESSALLVINTEGATDPPAYQRIVGGPPV